MIALLLAAGIVTAEPPGMLPALLARIRLSVPDAREVTDLQVCNTQSNDPFMGLIVRATERKFEAKCRWVSSAELKAAWEQVP